MWPGSAFPSRDILESLGQDGVGITPSSRDRQRDFEAAPAAEIHGSIGELAPAVRVLMLEFNGTL